MAWRVRLLTEGLQVRVLPEEQISFKIEYLEEATARCILNFAKFRRLQFTRATNKAPPSAIELLYLLESSGMIRHRRRLSIRPCPNVCKRGRELQRLRVKAMGGYTRKRTNTRNLRPDMARKMLEPGFIGV